MAIDPPEKRLRHYIEHESTALLHTLRLYVYRAGLAEGDAASVAAGELLNEVVVEALEHAGRFDPNRAPKAWLLGIAANLIQRRQADNARRARREPLIRDLYPDDSLGEDELFDRIAALVNDPSAGVEADERIDALLAPLSEADRHVIRLAILYDLDGEALAHTLKIAPGTARVRLHRALNRLRAAHRQASGRDRYEA